MSKKTIEVEECDFCHTLEMNRDQVNRDWAKINNLMACDRCVAVLVQFAIDCGIHNDYDSPGSYSESSPDDRKITIDFDANLTAEVACRGLVKTLVFFGLIRPVKRERY